MTPPRSVTVNPTLPWGRGPVTRFRSWPPPDIRYDAPAGMMRRDSVDDEEGFRLGYTSFKMRLREARTSDVVKHAVMFLVCVALVIAAPWIPDNDPGKPTPDRLLQVMYGFFGLCMLFGFFLALGRWRREIVIDEDGLKLLDRGNLEWSLRWEEFGGWARSSGAIVVLDRSGAAVGSKWGRRWFLGDWET